MNRRRFLTSGLAIGGLGFAGVGLWVASGPGAAPGTLEAMLVELNRLDDKMLRSDGQWSASQVFGHCAQSIELSMSGYPEHKSEMFKATVGGLAFSLFAAKGSMKHNLAEAIPGADVLAEVTVIQALDRLKMALTTFANYQGELAEHFAYGKLSKTDYELAHLMHINEHMGQIKVA